MTGGVPTDMKLYENGFDCLGEIMHREGFKGFYRGFTINIVNGIGGATILFLYD